MLESCPCPSTKVSLHNWVIFLEKSFRPGKNNVLDKNVRNSIQLDPSYVSVKSWLFKNSESSNVNCRIVLIMQVAFTNFKSLMYLIKFNQIVPIWTFFVYSQTPTFDPFISNITFFLMHLIYFVFFPLKAKYLYAN